MNLERRSGHMTVLPILVAMLSGAVLWTLLEYFIHRFLGHDRRTFPNPFGEEHARHHSEGDYFGPTWKKALVAVAVVGMMAPVATLVAGHVYGPVFAVSFTVMYVAYEVVYRRAHTHRGINAYGRWLRRHHFHHHFGNPRMNHGVTSPVWDVVFGTLQKPGRIRVPRKLQMRWLVDPATGAVREDEAAYYELVGREAAGR